MAQTAVKSLGLSDEELAAWTKGIDLVRAMEAYNINAMGVEKSPITDYTNQLIPILNAASAESIEGQYQGSRVVPESDTGCVRIPTYPKGLPRPIFFHSLAGLLAMAKIVEFGLNSFGGIQALEIRGTTFHYCTSVCKGFQKGYCKDP